MMEHAMNPGLITDYFSGQVEQLVRCVCELSIILILVLVLVLVDLIWCIVCSDHNF